MDEDILENLARKSRNIKKLRVLYSSEMGISATSTLSNFIVQLNQECPPLEEIRLWKFSNLAMHGSQILESFLANESMHISLLMLDLRSNQAWWRVDDDDDFDQDHVERHNVILLS